MTRIAFIGGGNMARAIAGGLLQLEQQSHSLIAADPFPEARAALQELGIEATDDNDAAARGADAIVLAVKPQVLPEVCSSLRPSLDGLAAQPLVISIAAGVPSAVIENTLGPVPLVRCMPNTPALIGRGITALVANGLVKEEQRTLAELILGAAGETLWMEQESDLDAVTAVSGSGPAYAFALIEHMERAGVELGLTEEVARRLAISTVAGAGLLAQQSDVSPAVQRERVTSPGGTTAAALAEFDQGGFEALVGRAINAAHERSRELGAAAAAAIDATGQPTRINADADREQ